MSTKRRFIKDPVWGSIEFFPWEGTLLSHFLINRLHGVVQNSSAYKVYPGLKHSRFLHSVGVLHVANQIFINIIINSDDDVKEELMKECAKIEKAFDGEALKNIRSTICKSAHCAPEYAVMLACVRVAALLHDIGHLPYSHLFEHAINGFLDATYEASYAPELSKKTKKLKERLSEILPETDVKIHEFLGQRFADVLASDLLQAGVSGQAPGVMVTEAGRILHSEAYPIVKGIISSDLDADRIDFIRRDGFFSGLIKSAVDYERLFSFYKLDWVTEGTNKRAVARPSRRSVSEVEKLLWERFQVYQYIVTHHRVQLYDELLERLLVNLINNGSLNDFLENLIALATLRKDKNLAKRGQEIALLKRLLLFFDDPWLDMRLRTTVFPEKPTANQDLEQAIHLFCAFAEQRTQYKTAFKYDSDYEKRFASTHDGVSLEIAGAVLAKKYSWEQELFATSGIRVIFADTMKKVNSGIKDRALAHQLGLANLDNFLSSKTSQIMAFNFWYVPEDNDAPKKTEEKIMVFVGGKLMKDVALRIQNNLKLA